MSTENHITPLLRFPEFKDNSVWAIDSGTNLFQQTSNREHNSDLPILAVTMGQGAIPRDRLDLHVSVSEESIKNYKIIEIDDFIISLCSFVGGIEHSKYKGLCSPAYVILRKKRSDLSINYFKHLFKSTQFIRELTKNLQGIRNGKMISYNQFSDVYIPFPQKKEQEKIANCLSSIDNLIALEEKKLIVFSDYKKGLVQSIFPFKGKALPKNHFSEFQKKHSWQHVAIGEVLSEHKLKNEGNCEVHSVSVKKRVVNQIEHLGRSYAAADTSNYNLVKPFDIIYTKSPTGDFPFGIVRQSLKDYNVIVSPLYGVFTPLNKHLGYILDAYFESPDNANAFLEPIIQKGAKNTINITNETFLSGKIYLPKDKSEQKEIAQFLSYLDSVITAQEQKIKTLKVHQSGLLQKLIPSINQG